VKSQLFFLLRGVGGLFLNLLDSVSTKENACHLGHCLFWGVVVNVGAYEGYYLYSSHEKVMGGIRDTKYTAPR